MPTYDYRCKACGHALELFQSITEGPKRKCPACGKNQLERQIGAGAGFIFKGTGFYQTDYRSESYTKGAKAETPGGAETKKTEASSSGEAKSDASKSGDAATGSAPAEPAAKPAAPKAVEPKPSKKPRGS